MTINPVFSARNLVKLVVGLPVAFMALITVVQLPKVWAMSGGNLNIIALAVLQGGLPLLPFVLFALAIWCAADMISRVKPDIALEPLLIRGLGRCGLWLILGSAALLAGLSDWAWHTVYDNVGPQPLGRANDYLLAAVLMLIGVLLIIAARRIEPLYSQRRALQSELSQFV
jgi:hypothetical protein